MNKLIKYIVPAVLVGLAIAGSVAAQVTSPNYWKANTASSTISPINPALQVPCANIVGGCGGGGSSTSSPNTFTVTGNATTTISGTAGSSSIISNLNSVLYVPTDFAIKGCAGSASNNTLDKCVIALYASASSTKGVTIWITADVPSSSWTNSIIFNINQVIPSLKCTSGVKLHYGGAANASSALIFSFNVSSAHDVSDDSGCTYLGQSSVISAGQTNTATTTGIYFGGTVALVPGGGGATTTPNNAANDINFHDNTVNGFGRQVSLNANTYMASFNNDTLSGGNGGGMLGSCAYILGPASNSGERDVFDQVNCTDPGNSTTTNAVYITNGGTASVAWTNSSFDDAQIYCGASNGICNFNQDYFENSDYSQYGRYIPFVNPSSDLSTSISFNGNKISNDTSGANSFDTVIKHGGQLTAIGNHIDNYGGGTITNFSDHSNDNGLESEMICQTQVQSGALTNIIAGAGGTTYTQAKGNACWIDTANSYAIAVVANQNNTNDLYSGNTIVSTFDHTGLQQLYTQPGASTGQLDFSVGDSVAANQNPFTVSHKDGSSSGALTSLGFNAYIASTPQLINTSTAGWLVEYSNSNGADANPLKFEWVASNSIAQTVALQLNQTSANIWGDLTINGSATDTISSSGATSTLGSPLSLYTFNAGSQSTSYTMYIDSSDILHLARNASTSGNDPAYTLLEQDAEPATNNNPNFESTYTQFLRMGTSTTNNYSTDWYTEYYTGGSSTKEVGIKMKAQGASSTGFLPFDMQYSNGSTLYPILYVDPVNTSTPTPNVGIGMKNPSTKFDVFGNGRYESNGNTALTISRSSTAFTGQLIFDVSSTDEWAIQQRNDSTQDIHIRDSINGRNAFIADQNGHQGIGTPSTPSTTLQVVDPVNNSSTVRIGSSGHPGCLEMYDAVNSTTIDYMFPSSTTWIVQTTKPSFCQ